MNIELPTGRTVSVSAYEYYFLLKDDEIDEFFQYLIADNAGIPSPDDPFSNRASLGKIEIEKETEDIQIDES